MVGCGLSGNLVKNLEQSDEIGSVGDVAVGGGGGVDDVVVAAAAVVV